MEQIITTTVVTLISGAIGAIIGTYGGALFAAKRQEKHIKELSEQELRDETIVKVILQHCFDDKEDISAMAKGNSLDKLVEKVMELIREVYL